MTLITFIAWSLLVSWPASASERAARGREQPPSIVQRLLGDWRGTGTVTGRASEITLQWTLDLGGSFVHLRFRNAMAADATRPAQVFEGRGYYRLPGGAGATSGTGTWIDSRGLILPVSVTISADAFQSDWGAENTERGRTIYRLTGDGALEVTDFVRAADDTYREFGRSVLRRVPVTGGADNLSGAQRE
jgi:hypothetical protein